MRKFYILLFLLVPFLSSCDWNKTHQIKAYTNEESNEQYLKDSLNKEFQTFFKQYFTNVNDSTYFEINKKRLSASFLIYKFYKNRNFEPV